MYTVYVWLYMFIYMCVCVCVCVCYIIVLHILLVKRYHCQVVSNRLLDRIIGSIVYNWFIEFLQRSKPLVSGGVGGYFLPGHLHMGVCTCALAYLFTYLSIYFQDQEVPSLQPMVKVLPEFPSFQRVWNTAGRLPYDYHMISITLP